MYHGNAITSARSYRDLTLASPYLVSSPDYPAHDSLGTRLPLSYLTHNLGYYYDNIISGTVHEVRPSSTVTDHYTLRLEQTRVCSLKASLVACPPDCTLDGCVQSVCIILQKVRCRPPVREHLVTCMGLHVCVCVCLCIRCTQNNTHVLLKSLEYY